MAALAVNHLIHNIPTFDTWHHESWNFGSFSKSINPGTENFCRASAILLVRKLWYNYLFDSLAGELGGESKVGDFDVKVLVQQNVLQFEVTMNQIVALEEHETLGDLGDDSTHFAFDQPTQSAALLPQVV